MPLNRKLLLLIPVLMFVGVGFYSVSAESLVPSWIKNTALWYGEGSISEQEFLDSMQFLINNNIIFLDKVEKGKVLDPIITSDDVIVTKPRINQCSVLYQAYKNVGKIQFVAKYDHITFINTCVKLYQDPIWNYQGEDRVDKLNERFMELNQTLKEERAKLSYATSIKIISKTDIGQGKYDVKFNACAGDKRIDKAKILVKSEIEAVQVGTSKDIPENSCRTYVTQLHAKNPANIQASVLEEVFVE
ncbi:plastocyanin [Nitrosopumilus piranensis]|uniref:Blue (Type1) copper domain-containing protein n=1 Tax=Nitrosopumilus piranensis TaxID=1582439 RepID=A0A0C5BVP9_9ARCH|nr:plastocyanin [Nitrosopumilus piranensis]AJM92324.1 Blue (Type1) copper domain-containing protein [Nitrosopumilus piranensis]